MPTFDGQVVQVTEMTDVDLEREFESDDRLTCPLPGLAVSSEDRSNSSIDIHKIATNQELMSSGVNTAQDGNKLTVSKSKRDKGQESLWKSFKKAGNDFNQDTRRMFRSMGRKLHSRGRERQTKVKEIRILPDIDNRWATRIAGSATSRSSTSTDVSDPSV